ncbi:MAG TPA: Ppx/GppA phosphatase family protein [Mycobacteriales bacterium]|nr:Ppx/GppA phosphatase family protein [Mycobacteriales bacterium]
MARVAGIDCGTNSIRLLVADIEDGVVRDVDRELRIVRLGQGVDQTGRLAPEAIERTRVALAEYAQIIADRGARKVRMVATSATRDAANRDDFHDMVRATLGQSAEVITGPEEAALSYTGAIGALAGPADQPHLVVDIGGGSTEFIIGTADRPGAARSVDIGCVRMTERHLRSDPPTAEQIAAARADIRAAIEEVRQDVPVQDARTLIGVAGTVTTVAAIAMELPAYQPDRIHGSTLSAAQVHEVTTRLLAMPREERAALPVMHPGRVDVIGGGSLVLQTIVEQLQMPEVVVSEHDILDGIALSIA